MIAQGGGVSSGKLATQPKTTSAHQTFVWVGSIVVLLLLWQMKSLHPFIKGLLVLVTLGMLLKFYPNISKSFSQLKL